MKKIDLGQTIAILANLGVLAGIVLLAIEVQQNTDVMQAQTRDTVTSKQIEFYLAASNSEFVTDVYNRGRLGEFVQAGISNSSEGLAWTFFAISNFRIWENEWYQYQKGLFEEAEFSARSSNWGNLTFGFPGLRSAWEGQKSSFEESFREYLDSQIASQEN